MVSHTNASGHIDDLNSVAETDYIKNYGMKEHLELV